MIVVGDVMKSATTVMGRRFGTILLCELVMLLIATPIIGLFLTLEAAISDELVMFALTAGLSVFLLIPLQTLLGLGFYRVLLSAYRDEPTSVGALFGEGRLLLAGLFETILLEAGMRICMLPLLIPALLAWLAGSRTLAISFLLLSLIPLAWFLACSIVSTPFVVDRRLGGFAALQASFQATRGHRGAIFSVLFTCLLLIFAGALPCGLGLIYTIPLCYLMTVDLYTKLSKPVSTCPLCQEQILLDQDRCPACDEWIPSRVLPDTRCRHCKERVAPAEECPFCAQPDPVLQEEGADPALERWSLQGQATRPSLWLAVAGLVLVIPFMVSGDDPRDTLYWTNAFLNRFSALPSWLGISLTIGVQTIPAFAGIAAIIVRARASRSSDADELGATFGRTPLWRGLEIPWERVEGFRITSAGVMLKVKGNPFSRWFGPTLRLAERDVHDLVVRLEGRGILNLAG